MCVCLYPGQAKTSKKPQEIISGVGMLEGNITLPTRNLEGNITLPTRNRECNTRQLQTSKCYGAAVELRLAAKASYSARDRLVLYLA